VQRAAQEHGVRVHALEASIENLRASIEEYRALFRPQQLDVIHERRQTAIDAMRAFAEFEPRLAGSLVFGDGPLDRVRLMLSAETPEQVLLHLNDQHIPWHEGEVNLQFAGNQRATRPAFRFMAGDVTIELVVLKPADRSNPPREPIGGAPLRLLDVDQVTALIADD
jgi:hypothetical protein